MFLRAAKTEAEEAGESTEGMASSVSELRAEILALTGNKVDIMLDADTFKSTTQIMRELSAEWKNLSDISRSNILEMIGGKRNSNVVAALLENFSTVEEVLEKTGDASGSALAENAKVLDSIEGKISKLKASFEKLSTQLFNSDTIKTVIDALTGVLDILSSIVETAGELPVIMGSIVSIMSARRVHKGLSIGWFSPVGDAESGYQAGFRGKTYAEHWGNIKGRLSGISARRQAGYGILDALRYSGNQFSIDAIKQIKDYNFLLKSAPKSATKYAEDLQKSEQAIGGYFATLNGAPATMKGFEKHLKATAQSLESVEAGAKKASFGAKAFGVAMRTLTSIGISMAIDYLISLMGDFRVTATEVAQAFNDANNKMEEMNSDIYSNASTIADLNSKYQKLSEGVNDLGQNVSLTESEYEDYKSVISQISEIMPNLSEQFNAQGEKIGFTAGRLKDLNEQYDTYIQNSARAFVYGSGTGDENEVTLLKLFELNADQKVKGFWEKGFSGLLSLIGLGEDDPTREMLTPQQRYNFLNNLSKYKSKSDFLDDISSNNGQTNSSSAFGFAEYDLFNTDSTMRAVFGVSLDDIKEMTEEDFLRWRSNTLMPLVAGARAEIESQENTFVQGAATYIKTLDEWKTLSNESKDSIVSMITGLDSSRMFQDSSGVERLAPMQSKTQGLIDIYQSTNARDSIDFLVDKGYKKLTYSDALKQTREAINTLTKESGGTLSNRDLIELFGLDNFYVGADWNTYYKNDAGISTTPALMAGRLSGLVKGANAHSMTQALYSSFTLEDFSYLEQLSKDGEMFNSVEEVVEAIRNLRQEAERALPSLSTLTSKLVENKQVLADEYQKASDWGLEDYLPQIADGTIQSVFGNVDMNKRTIITWTDALKETYKDALASWEYDPEVGGIDTVFGQSGRFGEDINGVGWEIAFTPILPDGTFLSKDTVSQYIETIVAEAYKNDSKVTEGELKAADAQGRQIGDTFVKGIFAGVDEGTTYENNGNRADVIGRLMHFSGKFGAVEIAKENIDAVQAQIDALGSLTKELDNIQSAYNKVRSAIDEYNDTGYLSVDTFQELMTLEPEYLRYLTDEEGNLKLTTDAMNEYTYALIDNLAQKQMDKIVSYVDGLSDEERQLYLTKGATDKATVSLADFVAATMAAQVAAGKLSEDELANLETMLNNVASWAEQAKAGIGKGGLWPGGGKSGKTRAEADQEYAEAVEDAYESAKEAKEKYAETVADINEDLAEKEKQFAEDMAEAWEKEHLEQLKDNLAKQKDIIDKYKENLEVTDFGLDFVGENDFMNRSDLLASKVEDLTNYGIAMREEFERIAAIIPQTGEEAQAVADRLSELGDEMRSNISNLRETKVAIEMLRIEAFTMIAEDGLGDLQRELDNIDRRLEILNADDKDDFKYTRKFLNMTSLLPSNGSFEAERREKQRNDRELIALERETQNQINEVISQALEMQARENAEAREKERQNLIKDMEKARQDAAKKMADAQKDLQKNLEEAGKKIKKATDDYKKELGNAEAATSELIQNVESMIEDMNIVFPEPDISNIENQVSNIKDMIQGVQGEIDSLSAPSTPSSADDSNFSALASGTIGQKMANLALQYVGQRNTNYQFSYGRDEEWCADFISYLADKAGIPVAQLTRGSHVSVFRSFFKNNGTISGIPTVGSIAMRSDDGHVGIVVGVDDDTITLVEGNAGNISENSQSLVKKNIYNKDSFIKKGWKFGTYATGTSFHPGGLAMVGDENWLKGWKTPSPELAIYPNGSSEVVGKDGVEIRDLPRGTKVLPADQTKDVLSGIPHYANGIGLTDLGDLLETLRTWSNNAMSDAQLELGKAQLRGKSFDPNALWEKYSWSVPFNGSTLTINGYNMLQQIITMLEQIVSTGITELENSDDLLKLASTMSTDSPYKQMKEQKAEFERQARESGTPVAINDSAIKDYLWGQFFKAATEKEGLLYDDFDALRNIDNYRVGGLHGANAEILDYYESLQSGGIGAQERYEEAQVVYSEAWNKAMMAVGKGTKSLNDVISDLMNPSTELGGAFNSFIEACKDRDSMYYTLAEEWKNRDQIAIQAIEKENEELNSLIGNSSKTPLVLGGGTNSDYLDFVKELQPHKRGELLRRAATEGESFDGLSMSPDIIGDYMEAMTELAAMNGDTLPVWHGWQRVAISNETGNIIPWDEWGVHIEHPGAMSRTFMPIEGYEGKYGLEGSNMFITKDGQIIQRGMFATTFFDKDDYSTAKVVPNAEATELIPESIRDLVLAVSTYEEATQAYLADRDKQQTETTSGTGDTDKSKRDPRLDEIDSTYAQYMKDFSALKNGLGKAQTAIDESDYTDKQKSYLLYGLAESGKYDALELSLRAAEDLTKAKELYMAEMGDNYDIEVLEAYDEAISKIGSSIYDLEADAAERKDKLKAEVVEDIEFYISKLSSLQSLTQAHFDTTNSIEEARHQINKELEASKRMYEYLDEDTRKLLFDQEDYNILFEELNSLQKETEKLQANYNKDILSATEEELDGITNQYQRQYDLVMKKYEIVKAELEVEKKRQQLDNVLNEKNVQMLINGEWQWVANTQDVINAQNELADAEFAAQQARTGMSQTQNLNEFSLAQDNLNILIKKIDSGVIDIFNEDVTAISDSLKNINNYDIPVLHDIMMGVAGSMVGFVETINTVLPVMGSLQGLLESGKLGEAESDYLSEMLGSEYKDGKWLHREYVPDNNAWQKIEPTDSAIRLNGMLIPKESTGIRINGQVYTKVNSDSIPQLMTLDAKDFRKSVNTFYPSIPDNMVRASNDKTYQINIDTVSLQKLDDPNRFIKELITIAETTRF